MLIKIERYYTYPDIKRQTPNNSFKWREFTFTEEDVDSCDFLVILDYPKKDLNIRVNKNNILHICLEPPNEISKYRQYANKTVTLNFNQTYRSKNAVLSHGALPWHIDKNYDELSSLSKIDLIKEDKIVWVTSNKSSSKGHQNRMNFLNKIQPLKMLNVYGKGINPIDDKWNVLKTSKYAIAYENYKSDYYWTEKITDAFLSYNLPIYYGCNKIENYFPKESFINLDPYDRHIDLYLREIVTSNLWQKRLDAIVEARKLVLDEYQLFPFLYTQIKGLIASKGKYQPDKKELVFVRAKDYYDNYPYNVKIEKEYLKYKKRILKRFKN
tara:strand:+ start:2367 stop:3344 length:978 start_codon:yes stop_codon:yes gene_type:complete